MSATGKHYTGHGTVSVDSHDGTPRDPRTLSTIEQSDLIPFAKLIPELQGIMSAHIVFPEIDAQPIVWAHDLGEEKNARLREFYRDRTFWRVIVGDSNRAALERWSPINNSFEMVNWFQ